MILFLEVLGVNFIAWIICDIIEYRMMNKS
jgi:hypothetical protein